METSTIMGDNVRAICTLLFIVGFIAAFFFGTKWLASIGKRPHSPHIYVVEQLDQNGKVVRSWSASSCERTGRNDDVIIFYSKGKRHVLSQPFYYGVK